MLNTKLLSATRLALSLLVLPLVGLSISATVPALAQPAATAPAPASATPAAAASAAPAPADPGYLKVYFDTGSATLRSQDMPTLDKATRTFRDGQPIVMILTGSTDTVGTPLANLELSQRRAQTVLHALVARGIPAQRFQLLAKGETEPAVPDPADTPQEQDRFVEIAWR